MQNKSFTGYLSMFQRSPLLLMNSPKLRVVECSTQTCSIKQCKLVYVLVYSINILTFLRSNWSKKFENKSVPRVSFNKVLSHKNEMEWKSFLYTTNTAHWCCKQLLGVGVPRIKEGWEILVFRDCLIGFFKLFRLNLHWYFRIGQWEMNRYNNVFSPGLPLPEGTQDLLSCHADHWEDTFQPWGTRGSSWWAGRRRSSSPGSSWTASGARRPWPCPRGRPTASAWDRLLSTLPRFSWLLAEEC